MDALGIQAAVIDEFWGYDSDTDEPQPGHHVEGGAFRPVAPGAQMASLRYPDRFSYLLRIDYRDPDLDSIAKQTAANPAGRALRVEARKPHELRDLSDGKFAAAFASAGKYQLPICVLTVDNAPLRLTLSGFPTRRSSSIISAYPIRWKRTRPSCVSLNIPTSF
jgi:hypothetical protein